jgi:hypothetical protein
MLKEGTQLGPVFAGTEVNPSQGKVESGLFKEYLPTFRESFKRARMFEELLTIGSGIGNELPSHFKSYLPDFPERFGRALRTSPMDMLFRYESDRWNIDFFTTINKVDRACAREKICGHGLDHVSRVAQNAFALADKIPNEYRGDVISDENLTLAALVHDLGYADKDVIWKNYEALGHDEKSSKWLGKKDDREFKFLGRQKLEGFFYNTIELNNKEKITPLVGSTVEPTTEDLFMYTIFFADKLDYFRTERVQSKGVERPNTYEDNPYFFQADAVEEYTVTSDEVNLYYNVKIKETNISKKDGSIQHVDFDWWKKEIEKSYGWILHLGQSYAKIIDKQFIIKALPTEKIAKSEPTSYQIFPWFPVNREICNVQ